MWCDFVLIIGLTQETVRGKIDSINHKAMNYVYRECIMKTAWQKPELIVLLRSKPEEAVLTFCKSGTIGGPNNEAGGCGIRPETWCVDCDSLAPS